MGFPPDADGIGNYAFFDAANYALIQMTVTIVQINRSHTNDWGVKPEIMPKIMLASGGRPNGGALLVVEFLDVLVLDRVVLFIYFLSYIS